MKDKQMPTKTTDEAHCDALLSELRRARELHPEGYSSKEEAESVIRKYADEFTAACREPNDQKPHGRITRAALKLSSVSMRACELKPAY